MKRITDGLTRQTILTLPDVDLVVLVAERVMGWRDVSAAWMNGEAWSGYYVAAPHREENYLTGKIWSPLTDWNHCMMVVEAMRAKGWRFSMEDHGILNKAEYHCHLATVSFYLQDSKMKPMELTAIKGYECRDIIRAVAMADPQG